MPSNLPVIKANTNKKNIEKMKVIAKKNKRSVAKELEYIIENHIKAYEAEHGEIKVDIKNEGGVNLKTIQIINAIEMVMCPKPQKTVRHFQI